MAMTGAATPITGRCLCGAVTYSADAEPVAQAVCHCTDCQRQTGNPFSVIVGVPRAAFNVEGDTLASFTTTGEDHGGDTERYFCSACGSPLYSLSEKLPGMIIIKGGTLDDPSWVQPQAEVWGTSAQPWVEEIEGRPRVPRGPGAPTPSA